MKRAYLALESSPLQKAVYTLTGTTTIGRSLDNLIRLADPTVSRYHAKVSFIENAWIIEDLGSANGVVFEGQLVETLSLTPGDVFLIGAHTFRYLEGEPTEESDHFFDTVEILMAPTLAQGPLDETVKADNWVERVQNIITKIPFFSSLGEAESRQLMESGSLHVFQAGETIIREGDGGRSIYVILNGRVRVFTRDYYGKELELAVLEAGQFVGEMSFLTGQPRSSSVTALDTTVLIELGYTSMRSLVEQYPEVKKILMQYYQERVGSTQKKRAQVGMEERRNQPRLMDQVMVNLVVPSKATPESKSTGSSWQAVSVDISLSGIVVTVTGAELDAFHLNGPVHLTIELPTPWGQIRSLGTVRRVESASKEEKKILIGVVFAGMAATESKKLRQFIYGESHALH
jgi:CRP-like cAMP-binding protein